MIAAGPAGDFPAMLGIAFAAAHVERVGGTTAGIHPLRAAPARPVDKSVEKPWRGPVWSRIRKHFRSVPNSTTVKPTLLICLVHFGNRRHGRRPTTVVGHPAEPAAAHFRAPLRAVDNVGARASPPHAVVPQRESQETHPATTPVLRDGSARGRPCPGIVDAHAGGDGDIGGRPPTCPTAKTQPLVPCGHISQRIVQAIQARGPSPPGPRAPITEPFRFPPPSAPRTAAPPPRSRPARRSRGG